MNIHSKGQEAVIKELNLQKRDKIIEVIESNLPKGRKGLLIKKVLMRFDKLIKDTDQSLFIEPG